jgi:hypothetical protein
MTNLQTAAIVVSRLPTPLKISASPRFRLIEVRTRLTESKSSLGTQPAPVGQNTSRQIVRRSDHSGHRLRSLLQFGAKYVKVV